MEECESICPTGGAAFLSWKEKKQGLFFEALAAADHPREAAILLEFAVGTGTDVSQTYYQLAAYWAEEGDSARIEQLIQAAEGLRSSNRNTEFARVSRAQNSFSSSLLRLE